MLYGLSINAYLILFFISVAGKKALPLCLTDWLNVLKRGKFVKELTLLLYSIAQWVFL